jgi:hypothetical protein
LESHILWYMVEQSVPLDDGLIDSGRAMPSVSRPTGSLDLLARKMVNDLVCFSSADEIILAARARLSFKFVYYE